MQVENREYLRTLKKNYQSFWLTLVSQKYQELSLQVENREYLRMLKEKLPIFLINTLLLHIPLLALTHRQNYGETNRITEEQIHSLRVGRRTFFSSCAVVSVFGSGGK